MSNIPTWVSAGAATASFIFTVVSWYFSNKSKEAKAKADEVHKAALDMRDAAQRSVTVAEEQANQAKRSAEAAEKRAQQAEELLKQMSDIASSLRGPVLELTKAPGYPYYILRNKTESSIKILKVLNHEYFYYSDYSDELPRIPEEVHPGKPINLCLPHKAFVTSLDLQIEVSGKEETLYVEIPE
ncbi:hypothetical protein [uncultured Rothia sp.]|uniref:hypothetical protein n=1 Tax=uncultured Rothia sp. TaxID=316088 RepID=UPI0028DB140D|nr:hypothetical protein [uncultured Rothia sp.]